MTVSRDDLNKLHVLTHETICEINTHLSTMIAAIVRILAEKGIISPGDFSKAYAASV